MIRQLLRYLFPKARLQTQLPLLPLAWSSRHSRTDIPPDLVTSIMLLKGHGLAVTDEDALRLFDKYPGKETKQVIRLATRKRRREPALRRAIRRLKKLW